MLDDNPAAQKTPFILSKTAIPLAVLGIILAVSLSMRLTSAAETSIQTPIQRDAADYFMYAYNLRHKHVYSQDRISLQNSKSTPRPDAVRSPGYPVYISPFINGPPTEKMIAGITLSQALLSGFTVFLSFLLFKTFLSFAWAAGATLLIGISPHLIVANSYLLTETLFCFFLVLMAWFMRLLFNKQQLWQAAGIGIIMTMASLVRPSLQYFAVVFSLFLLFQLGRHRGGKAAIMVIIGFALCFSPWLIRNIYTIGATSDKSLMINFLHHGMYPNFIYGGVKESYGLPYHYDPRSPAIGRNISSVLQEILRRFQHEPARHLHWFLLGKPVAFWSWNMVQGAGGPFVYPPSRSPYFSNLFFKSTYHLMQLLHRPVVFLALLGALAAWLPLSRIGAPGATIFMARVISLLLIYYTLMHMIGAPFPRYSVPLRPFLYGLALFPPHLLFLVMRKK